MQGSGKVLSGEKRPQALTSLQQLQLQLADGHIGEAQELGLDVVVTAPGAALPPVWPAAPRRAAVQTLLHALQAQRVVHLRRPSEIRACHGFVNDHLGQHRKAQASSRNVAQRGAVEAVGQIHDALLQRRDICLQRRNGNGACSGRIRDWRRVPEVGLVRPDWNLRVNSAPRAGRPVLALVLYLGAQGFSVRKVQARASMAVKSQEIFAILWVAPPR